MEINQIQVNVISSQHNITVLEIVSNEDKYILKYSTSDSDAEIIRSEKMGLDILRIKSIFLIPQIISYKDQSEIGPFILMEYLDTTIQYPSKIWEDFAKSLSLLHSKRSLFFGLDNDNFIGPLKQSNNKHSSFYSFYSEERLTPQITLAYNNALLSLEECNNFDILINRLSEIIPSEKPSLIHGDLWNGNFIFSSSNKVCLIDPSVSYAHREMDIAMTLLFGGFDSIFYSTYQSILPMTKNWQGRMDIYQLYYLLVHLNIFGFSYKKSIIHILNKYK